MNALIRKLIPVHRRAAIVHRLKSLYAFFYIDDLNKLALIHGSDKWGGHWYTQHYDFHFNKIRERKLKILEIGVGGYDTPYLGGSSLRMWKSYFRHSQITSLDIIDKTP
ncbi:MAG TPA: hypothetical protein VG737_04325, partial [Cyclobacteriaceae bacterium]|nr:hypothetical protein [Cyclobacteriaceae bacterium]